MADQSWQVKGILLPSNNHHLTSCQTWRKDIPALQCQTKSAQAICPLQHATLSFICFLRKEHHKYAGRCVDFYLAQQETFQGVSSFNHDDKKKCWQMHTTSVRCKIFFYIYLAFSGEQPSDSNSCMLIIYTNIKAETKASISLYEALSSGIYSRK